MSTPLAYDQNDLEAIPVQDREYDLEKNKGLTSSSASSEAAEPPMVIDDKVKRTGVLWELTEKLSKYGVEGRGIERIFPHERSQKSVMGCFWMCVPSVQPQPAARAAENLLSRRSRPGAALLTHNIPL